MNIVPKSLKNEFQIQVRWKGKDSGFVSWSFVLRKKMVPIVCQIVEKQVKVHHFSIAYLDIP
jgi:hypothetical protein